MATLGWASWKVSMRFSFQPVPGARKVSHFILTVSDEGAAALPLPAAGAAPGAAAGAQAARAPAMATKPLICRKLRREIFLDIIQNPPVIGSSGQVVGREENCDTLLLTGLQ